MLLKGICRGTYHPWRLWEAWGPSHQIHGCHSKTIYSSKLLYFSSLSISHLLKEFQFGNLIREIAVGHSLTGGQKNLKIKNVIFSLKTGEICRVVLFQAKLRILWQKIDLASFGLDSRG